MLLVGSRGSVAVIALLVGLALAEPPEIVQELLELDAPGSAHWDRYVAFRLKVAYDANHSGALEPREIRRSPCSVWQALDVALDEGSPYPGLLLTYGFVGTGTWLGGQLGIAEDERDRAARALSRCVDVPEDTSPDAELFLLGLLQNLPGAGTPAWEGFVASALVQTYDRDGSGLIDPGELQAAECVIWLALEIGLARERRSLADYVDDPHRLGIASGGALAERAEACVAP